MGLQEATSPAPTDEVTASDIDPADYPWTLEPAKHFSGVLDPRLPAAVPCWTSKRVILKAIFAALTSPEGVTARKQEGCKVDGTGGGIAVKTVMAVAEEDCNTADSSTGRNIMTAHETVVRRLSKRGVKISWSSVRKARRLLRRLGFQAVVEEGRYLTHLERTLYSVEHATELAAKTRAGKRPYIPWRKASTRVFTMSAATVKKTGHLPRRGLLTPTLQKEVLTKTRSRAGSTEINPGKTRLRRSKNTGPRPLAVQKLAAHLKLSLGWLSSVGHMNTISDTLMRFNVDPRHWTGKQLIAAFNDRLRQRGGSIPEKITNPIGYLIHLLKDLDPETAVSTYHLPSRATEAARDAQKAHAELEKRQSPAHRAKQVAGWQQVREALRHARLAAAAA